MPPDPFLSQARRLAELDAATVLVQRLDVPDCAAECHLGGESKFVVLNWPSKYGMYGNIYW